MAFISFGKKLFFEKKVLLYFAFFSFSVYLLASHNKESSQTTILVFKKGAIELILRSKVWFYGFNSFLWQLLLDFLFVVYLLFFFDRIKNEQRQILVRPIET